eukprot:6160572-Ditylum_brightwellii.AAC.1
MADLKDILPDMFTVYPNHKDAILSFFDNNIGTMNVDAVYSYSNKYINIIAQNNTLFLEDDEDDN